MTGSAVAAGVGLALLIGLPFSIYANAQDNGTLVMIASLTTLLISVATSVIVSMKSK